jgi:hypothetical protein
MELPEPHLDVMRPGTHWYTAEQMHAYAAAAVAAERERVMAANDEAIRTGVRAFQSGYKESDPLADWRAFLSAVLDRA